MGVNLPNWNAEMPTLSLILGPPPCALMRKGDLTRVYPMKHAKTNKATQDLAMPERTTIRSQLQAAPAVHERGYDNESSCVSRGSVHTSVLRHVLQRIRTCERPCLLPTSRVCKETSLGILPVRGSPNKKSLLF